MSSLEEKSNMATYNKRPCTSGIRGQLYETKLLSLLLFRAQHNDSIEDFYLATNVDDIGSFDDIVFKAKVEGHSRPIVIFLQAKHRENEDKVLTLDNKSNLAEYFKSFIKIKAKFNPSSTDQIFKNKYDEVDCVFVLYTTEQSQSDEFDDDCADIVNDLIATGASGLKPKYKDNYVDFLSKIATKEEIRALATKFMKFIYNKNIDMNNELILRYHVILAQKVVHVSDIQPEGHRIGKFKLEFLSTKDDYLLLFKDKIYEEILKKHASSNRTRKEDKKVIHDLLSSFFTEPSEITLGDVIFENIITYRNSRLEFVDKMPENFVQQLKKIKLPQSEIDQGITRAIKDILNPFRFKLPATFGNKDLKLNGSQNKIKQRLKYKKDEVIKLLKKSESYTVTIDESNMGGLLKLNGGLGSAVGNILVYDDDTKLLKFTDNFRLLETHGKQLLEMLQSECYILHDYRLNIRGKMFPKLSFECNYEGLVEEFFSKVVFFAKQEDENGVGKILKQEIDDYEGADTKNFRVKSDAIFLHFHNEIQAWWMQKRKAEYLTKESDLYEKAKNSIIYDPMISVISMMYMTEINNIECAFNNNTLITFTELNLKTIIVTDVTKLTFIKLTHSFKVNDYVVLDLKYILKLSGSDLRALNSELKKINKDKIIVIICDNLQNIRTLHKNLQDIARALANTKTIVVTNRKFSEMIVKYFSPSNMINDDGNSLSDLTPESRNKIIKNVKAIFQGQEVSLDLLLDDTTFGIIRGAVLNKVLENETVTIGESLEFPNRPIELLRYDTLKFKYEIKDLYIGRRVSRGTTMEPKVIQTLHDLKDDVVLITAKPGMGKSTLLSYLSIKTKEHDEKVWLMRINLLDHSTKFNEWHSNKTEISTLEVLNFLCRDILKKKSTNRKALSISLTKQNDEVFLGENTDDEWSTFELELFLHFFKKRHIIFMFDGFDEICPNYDNTVISFLNVIRNYPQKHKIWITSRPYNKIKLLLQNNFSISEPYELEPFSDAEQEIYFEKFWKYNFSLSELNDVQLENLKGFINFMLYRHDKVFTDNFIRQNNPQNFLLNKVYYHFMVYLQNEIKVLPMASPLDWNYKDRLNVSARLTKFSQHLFRQDVGEKGIKDILEFAGTPLHLYLVADYFISAIKNNSDKTMQWDLDVNTYAIYENFIESKLKKIRFRDKNNMNIDNPDVIETYKSVRKDFIDMHKKLAAFAIFQRNGQKVFNKKGLQDIKYMMQKIKTGTEKTGLIYSVANNVPQFIHMTFTEYLAVEYTSDLLKKEKRFEKRNSLCHFILFTMLFDSPISILNIMDQKLKMDAQLASIIQSHGHFIFNLLVEQSVDFENDNDAIEPRMRSPLVECISKNLNNFLSVYINALVSNINKNNLDDVIKVIAQSGFLKLAVVRGYEDLLITVLTVVREIDVSKWRNFISKTNYYCKDLIGNTRLQRTLRHHILSFFVWLDFCRQVSLATMNEAA